MEPMTPMTPMKPMQFAPAWWPKDLGEPATSGGQDDLAYAFFPEKHRLAVRRAGEVAVYDSADHAITGVSQGGGKEGLPVFTSQHGTVDLDKLNLAG